MVETNNNFEGTWLTFVVKGSIYNHYIMLKLDKCTGGQVPRAGVEGGAGSLTAKLSGEERRTSRPGTG
jgi:hypothetical protein